MRNPPWKRDELILALALYFRAGRKQLDASHRDVVELSKRLVELNGESAQARGRTFRNANSVAMKLGNFSSIDPTKQGSGLSRGNRLEAVIWKQFAHQPSYLQQVAEKIESAVSSPTLETASRNDIQSLEDEFLEGGVLTRLHVSRERNRRVATAKKLAVLRDKGCLECEVCGFDFRVAYGKLGSEFAECHHIIPLAQLNRRGTTKLADLAIVCANCHRMLHRSDTMISIHDLRETVQKHRDYK